MTPPCPHCGADMAKSIAHCTDDDKLPTCDWRKCRSCGSAVAGHRHVCGEKSRGRCKRKEHQ